MWEIIERMATDRLWIYTALAGSAFGAAFLFWFKDTRIATWGVQKFDAFLEYLAIRWGWTWFQNDPNAWRVKYPKITAKIDEIEARLTELEKDSHPPVAPGGATELKDEIAKLEEKIKKLEGKKK